MSRRLILGWLDTLYGDIRFTARSFRRTPGVTAAIILTLALGIGANTAIFSAVHALLLRPLPFPEADRVMDVSLTRSGNPHWPASDDEAWSFPKYLLMRDAQHVFADIGLYQSRQVIVGGGSGGAERVEGEAVAGRYFATLGIRPILGRSFVPDEVDRDGAPATMLIGESLWQERFNADPSVLGRTLNVEGKPHTIVGVMPSSFVGMSGRARVWMPVPTQEGPGFLTAAYSFCCAMVARLAPGVTIAQAEAAVRTLGSMMDAALPDPEYNQRWGAAARPLDARRVDPVVRRSLLVLAGAVALVLMIACANVANLLLVRAARREREIAVRLAIGASRWRLVRQLMTESLCLAMVGGLAAVAVGSAGVQILERINPASSFSGLGVVTLSQIRLNPAALILTVVLALLTGVVFGLVPALQATRPSLVDELKGGRARSTMWRSQSFPGRGVLPVVEIGLAVVLLAGSGLMLRSLGKLIAVHPGFDGSDLLTMRLSLLADSAANASSTSYYERLLTRVRGLPGVTGAALTVCPPLSGGCNLSNAELADRLPMPMRDMPIVGVHWVTPGWFSIARVPLVRGRDFGLGDGSGARPVVIVSQTAARRLWPGKDPIGRPVRVGQTDWVPRLVVGVVGDVQYKSLDSPAGPDLYVPLAQVPRANVVVFLRTAVDPSAMASTAERVVRELDPNVPVYDVRTMASRAGDSMAFARFGTTLLTAFAVMALLLATLGIYSVIASSVALRRREIGIRFALGATPVQVMRLAVRDGVVLAAIGTALGIGAALLATRLLRALLFGVVPWDPVTFAMTVAVMAAAALAAAIRPAHRAAQVDPMVVLRDE
jgi:putative ABC transport system permease protein